MIDLYQGTPDSSNGFEIDNIFDSLGMCGTSMFFSFSMVVNIIKHIVVKPVVVVTVIKPIL